MRADTSTIWRQFTSGVRGDCENGDREPVTGRDGFCYGGRFFGGLCQQAMLEA